MKIKKLKKALILFFILILVTCFSSCSVLDILFGKKENDEPKQSPTDVPPQVITDPNWPVTICGYEINEKPKNVICATPDLCEYLFDMNLSDNIIGISDFCTFEIPDTTIKTVGTVINPSFEEIKSLSPEYIITDSPYSEEDLIKLQQMDIKVITFDSPKNLSEIKDLCRQVSIFFLGAEDGSEFGNSYVSEYEGWISEITYNGEKKKAALLRNLDKLMIHKNCIAGELISLSFDNLAGEYISTEYPEENWKDFDPDVLFVGNSIHIIDLENSSLYKKKTAVKNDRIFTADSDILNIGSKRSIDLMKNMLSTAYEDYTLGTAMTPAYPSKYTK